jgi:hypothetical protein
MTAYLWAAVGFGILAVAAYPVLSYLIDKPEGTHRRASWWRRIRDRRQEERAQDALNLRLIHDISESIARESTGRTSSGMPRTQWPLQPLPPGVEEAADHFHRPEEGASAPLLAPELEHYDDPQVMAYARMGEAAEPGWEDAVEDYAAAMHTGNTEAIADARNGGHAAYADHLYAGDPLDVATPEQVADELVGPLSTPVDTPAPEPEPAPLTDYGPATGSWEAVRDEVLDAIPLVDAVIPKDGA